KMAVVLIRLVRLRDSAPRTSRHSSVRSPSMVEVLGAFIVGVPLALGMIPLSHRLGLLDRPGPIKPHVRPIPYTGGSVIALVLVALGLFLRLPSSFLIGAVAIWLVGFVDDTKRLP